MIVDIPKWNIGNYYNRLNCDDKYWVRMYWAWGLGVKTALIGYVELVVIIGVY